MLPKVEKAIVNQVLEQVELIEQRNTQSGKLSGGQKRRLAIAIALIGAPSIMFLDEPTTGLDPEVKRQLWRVIQRTKSQSHCCIIMTTHSMLEADVLSDTIGIMVGGRLRCFGSGSHLKRLYGKGYKLNLTCLNPNRIKQISDVVQHSIADARLLSHNKAAIVFEFHSEGFGDRDADPRSRELTRRPLEIEDWGLTQNYLSTFVRSMVRTKFF